MIACTTSTNYATLTNVGGVATSMDEACGSGLVKLDANDEMHTEKAGEETNKNEMAVMPPSVAWREG